MNDRPTGRRKLATERAAHRLRGAEAAGAGYLLYGLDASLEALLCALDAHCLHVGAGGCENCAKPLPPESTEARIRSFECTFCANCVETVLDGVCPNCAGNFVPPTRPPRHELERRQLHRPLPATEHRRHRPVDIAAHRHLHTQVASVPYTER